MNETKQKTEILTSECLDPGPLKQPGGGVAAIIVKVLNHLLLLQRIPADPNANVCRHAVLLGSDPAKETKTSIPSRGNNASTPP
ncbi:hypothetical protein E2C01_022973 [Portunus trituberculatus]|uniref:Uncharacterized protein n=1 Tax=Portunus trituberculatus TaxID=210409 RepID=A0A5B7EAB7_PORTR|nr:hypothetical protein [Portunus trituberculatus]